MKYRVEKDSLGEKQITAESYYGIQTLRGKENFEITKRGISRQMIKALATVKKAVAAANATFDFIDEKKAKAIMLSCDEILNGRLHGQFITDLIQGGAGASMNMNANEVIANRANEMLGGKKGVYDLVHPIDHVNFGQSTNDVIPTAGKIALIRQTKKLIVELKKLSNSCNIKGKDFYDVIIPSRTHLQMDVPMRLGEIFDAFAEVFTRDIKRLEKTIESLYEINISINLEDNPKYVKKVVSNIAKFTGEPFKSPKNFYDCTRNLDGFMELSSALKILAVNLSKTCNDIRLMASSSLSSTPEINIPNVHPCSTNMPDRVIPAIPEMVNQVAFFIMGCDVTVTKAAEAGQLEINVFEPVIFMTLLDALNYLRRAIRTLKEKTIDGITANKEECAKLIENNNSLITTLIPYLGYNETISIANEALSSNKNIYDIVLERALLSEEKLNEILDKHNLSFKNEK